MATHSVKALETSYKGYRFRSRLEARWAVFFDELDFSYEYEPEGYEIRISGQKNAKVKWYLPDFYVHKLGFFEVKPASFKDEIHDALEAVGKKTNQNCYLVTGEPMASVDMMEGPGGCWLINPHWDCSYLFCTCPYCGKVGIEYEGGCHYERICGNKHAAIIRKKEKLYAKKIENLSFEKQLKLREPFFKKQAYHQQRLIDAAAAARAARF